MPSIPILNQNVTAASGFAYGVIGADLHVLGNGLPLYLLANWRPAPETDPAWLRELPQAFSAVKDACAIYQQREDPVPAEYSDDLAGTLSCAVWVLHALGRETESADLRYLIQADELARALELVGRLGPAGSPAPSR